VSKKISSELSLLIILPSLQFGGIERTTYNLIKNLKSFRVSLLLHRNLEPFFADLECNIYRLDDFKAARPTLSIQNLYRYAIAIKRVSSIEKPDIIFGIMQFAPIYAAFAKDIFFLRSRLVISYRGVVSEYLRLLPHKRMLRFLIRYSIKRAVTVIVPSYGVREDLIENFGASPNRIRVIYNGIDLKFVRQEAQESIDLEKDRPWIITSARLDTLQKDFLTLFKAFRIVRDNIKARLLIVGDGPDRERVTLWAEEMSLREDVLFLGFQKNPFKYLAKADVFVLSSFVEGFGNVIIEAMTLGVPVISTDCPSGPGEIIEHGTNGFLVRVGDYKTMAGFMLEILDNNELRGRFARNGLRRVTDFSAQKMASEYEKAFTELFYS